MLEATKFKISDPITSDNFAEMFENEPKNLDNPNFKAPNLAQFLMSNAVLSWPGANFRYVKHPNF